MDQLARRGGVAPGGPGLGHPRMPAVASGRRSRRARATSRGGGRLRVGQHRHGHEPLAQIMPSSRASGAIAAPQAELFVPVDDAGDVRAPRPRASSRSRSTSRAACRSCERPEMVQLFYDLGVRQIHLAYNRNNAISGGCYDDDIRCRRSAAGSSRRSTRWHADGLLAHRLPDQHGHHGGLERR